MMNIGSRIEFSGSSHLAEPGFWPFLFCLFLFAACGEPRKSCLDIEATNFDAAADENCCCEYPKLRIDTLFPRFGTLIWKPDTAYEYSPGKWFRMKSIVYYLSGFQVSQNGTDLMISDTAILKTRGTAGDTVDHSYINDFQLVRRSSTSYPAGTFRLSGDFDAIQFQVGISDSTQAVIPALAPTGHPLGIQGENMWLGPDTGFVALRIILTRDTFDTTLPDTLVFSRPDFTPVPVKKTGTFRHESGYDFKLKVIADYAKLFQGMDLSVGDISTWKTQIATNLPAVFSVSQ